MVKKITSSTVTTLTAPSLYWLKWNVDGSSITRKAGAAGIGGVLEDSQENFLCIFPYSIGVADSNVAELMAIEKALLFSNGREDVGSTRINIESDSSNAIS